MKYLLLSNEIFNEIAGILNETGPTLNENAFHSFVVAKQIFYGSCHNYIDAIGSY